MVILGLTGSIGMGKTTAANAFRALGVPVHDADAVVHGLMGPGGAAVAAVEAAFPGVVRDGAVDRKALAAIVFDDDGALESLEDILHPLVWAEETRFLATCARRHERLVVLDVPLLFEAGASVRCDLIAVVSAPERVQRQRVMARPGMTSERLAAILSRQMPDPEKRRRADFIIQTGLGRSDGLKAIRKIVRVAGQTRGRSWRPGWHSGVG